MNDKIHIFALMLERAYKILTIVAVIVLFTACKSYNVLRDGTPEEKFEYAKKLFEEEEYAKVSKIMEPIYVRFRQTTNAEMADWMVSYSFYKTGTYELASYLLNNFAREYPASPRAEEAVFLAAEASYKISPEYYLDPTHTEKAVSVLQRYIDTYPDGRFLEQADKMIRELNYKLERKAYEIAYNYYRLEEYQAAIIAFSGVLDDMPSNSFREQIMYYRLKAAYMYARESVTDKQQARYNDAITYARTFLKTFPTSEYAEEVGEIKAVMEKEYEEVTTAVKNLGKDAAEVTKKELKKEIKKKKKQEKK